VIPVDGSQRPIADLGWTSRTIEIQAVRDP
jgi:hypothetical protein